MHLTDGGVDFIFAVFIVWVDVEPVGGADSGYAVTARHVVAKAADPASTRPGDTVTHRRHHPPGNHITGVGYHISAVSEHSYPAPGAPIYQGIYVYIYYL